MLFGNRSLNFVIAQRALQFYTGQRQIIRPAMRIDYTVAKCMRAQISLYRLNYSSIDSAVSHKRTRSTRTEQRATPATPATPRNRDTRTRQESENYVVHLYLSFSFEYIIQPKCCDIVRSLTKTTWNHGEAQYHTRNSSHSFRFSLSTLRRICSGIIGACI